MSKGCSPLEGIVALTGREFAQPVAEAAVPRDGLELVALPGDVPVDVPLLVAVQHLLVLGDGRLVHLLLEGRGARGFTQLVQLVDPSLKNVASVVAVIDLQATASFRVDVVANWTANIDLIQDSSARAFDTRSLSHKATTLQI